MDNFDNKIKGVFMTKNDIPDSYIEKVNEALKKAKYDDSKKLYNIKKFVAIFVACVITLSGITYAGAKLYSDVWKKPEQFNYEEDACISEEEKSKVISEDKIKEIAQNKLKELGYDDFKIENVELVKLPYYGDIVWHLYSDSNNGMWLNAITGELYSFGIDKEKIPRNYRTNMEDAEKVANELYTYLGFKEGEYELTRIKGNMDSTGENSYFWTVQFNKIYNGVINDYQYICMSFIPEINKIISLNILNEEFDNNPINISEDEAIKIAQNKNLELYEDLEIYKMESSLQIKRMNAYFYIEENNLDKSIIINGQRYSAYKSIDTIRNVWCIRFIYTDNETHKQFTDYYVDTTTGEIIGGDGFEPKFFTE